jgi:diguanylate cyclase (GGDEF)-like protein
VRRVKRERSRHGGAEGNPFWEHAAWLEMVAALDWLPLATLVLTADGTVLGANRAWAALSAAPAEAARGDGWLRVVEPLDREPLRSRLREAAAVGETGCADFRLARSQGSRWSRWWWRPGPAGRLLACVTDLEEGPPRDDDRWRQGHGVPARLVRRSEFVNLVGRALRRSRTNHANLAVVAVSLDGLADTRSATGQHDRDAVLRAVAERILGAARPADVAALVGHDEFAVLCDDLRCADDARIVASWIGEVMGQPLEVDGVAVAIAAAIGFFVASSAGETAEELIARARLAASCSKQAKPAGPSAPARALSLPPIPPAEGRGGDSEAPALRACGQAPGTDAGLGLAEMAVHRLFGVGLILQSAAGLADGPVAARIQQAVDELDTIMRDVRTAVFMLYHPGRAQG